MKEYCLVPVSVAKQHMFAATSTAATADKETAATAAEVAPSRRANNTKKRKKKVTPSLQPAAIASPRPKVHVNPPLEHLLRVAVPPAFRDYGSSFLKLLDEKPGIVWDEQGNLLPPFQGLNVFDLIRSLGNAKGDIKKIPVEKRPLISMLFRLAQLPASVIVSNTQRSKLMGSGVKRAWEAY